MCWAADPVAVACLSISTFMKLWWSIKVSGGQFPDTVHFSPPPSPPPCNTKSKPNPPRQLFPFLFWLSLKKIRKELWRSPEFSCFSEQSIFKVRSDCSGNCSGKFWICKSGDSTIFLRLSCSVCYAPEFAVPLSSAGISLAMTCDCWFLGIHCMPLRTVCPWLLSIPLKSGMLLRSALSLPFLLAKQKQFS